MPTPIHPRVQLWLELVGSLTDAAESGYRRAQAALRHQRSGVFLTRRPGAETPMWNTLIPLLRTELKPHGTKARLARYLGLPRQRLNDFLIGKNRLPDAEITLRLLHWLAEKRSGRDPSL